MPTLAVWLWPLYGRSEIATGRTRTSLCGLSERDGLALIGLLSGRKISTSLCSLCVCLRLSPYQSPLIRKGKQGPRYPLKFLLKFRSSRPSPSFDGHFRLSVQLSCKSLVDFPERGMLASDAVENYLLQEETSRLGWAGLSSPNGGLL